MRQVRAHCSTRSTARRTSTRTSRSARSSRSTGRSRRASAGRSRTASSPGCSQVAAGYVIYGTSTILVYTTGHGVAGFTLDPSLGEFLLSHPDIQTPQRGQDLLGQRAEHRLVGRPRPGLRRVAQAGGQGHEPAALVALHRLARGRLPPQPALRRPLHVPGQPQGSERQAASPLRGRAARVHRGAGRRGSRPTARSGSSTSFRPSCTSARRSTSDRPRTSARRKRSSRGRTPRVGAPGTTRSAPGLRRSDRSAGVGGAAATHAQARASA